MAILHSNFTTDPTPFRRVEVRRNALTPSNPKILLSFGRHSADRVEFRQTSRSAQDYFVGLLQNAGGYALIKVPGDVLPSLGGQSVELIEACDGGFDRRLEAAD